MTKAELHEIRLLMLRQSGGPRNGRQDRRCPWPCGPMSWLSCYHRYVSTLQLLHRRPSGFTQDWVGITFTHVHCCGAPLRLLLRFFACSCWPSCLGHGLLPLGASSLLSCPSLTVAGARLGSFSGLVPIWMRIRLPVAQIGQRAPERLYFYAGPCKGATVAVW